MPIRSGAMQRPRDCRCGNTLRQRYDEVGLPCSSTMGSPSPTSTYAISRPRTRRRFFWYGNAAEIMLASPSEPFSDLRPHITTPLRTPLCITAKIARRCRSWVRLGHSAMSAQCPVCPQADTAGRFMSTRPKPAIMAGATVQCVSMVHAAAAFSELKSDPEPKLC